jgi:hypothetical protein
MSDRENFLMRWSRRKRAVADDETSPDSLNDETRARSESELTPPRSLPRAERSVARDPPLPGEGGTESVARADQSASEHASIPSAPASSAPPFDPTTLPSIESITAQTDIRAFLAPGVPPELARAALRRAWTVDPKIRDFVGLADYDWDFNAPGAMTGFGPLDMPEEVRRRLVDMIGGGGSPAPDEPAAPAAAPASASAPAPAEVEKSIESAGAVPPAPTQSAEADRARAQVEPPKDDSESHNFDVARQRSIEHVAVQNNRAKPDSDQTIVKRPHGRALPE